jgi:hypothetical protein
MEELRKWRAFMVVVGGAWSYRMVRRELAVNRYVYSTGSVKKESEKNG